MLLLLTSEAKAHELEATDYTNVTIDYFTPKYAGVPFVIFCTASFEVDTVELNLPKGIELVEVARNKNSISRCIVNGDEITCYGVVSYKVKAMAAGHYSFPAATFRTKD